MFFVNTWRWDYPLLAALVAPRPLLISNTDKDTIFPLEGVVEVHRQVRHIYQLYGKSDQLGLNITEGPHKDTQELRTHAFVWLNRFLRNDTTQFTTIATPFFEPEQLRVFQELPRTKGIRSSMNSLFLPQSSPSPEELTARMAAPTEWMSDLRGQIQTRCFAAWPSMDSLSHVRDSVTTSPGKPILLQDSEFARTVVRFSSHPTSLSPSNCSMPRRQHQTRSRTSRSFSSTRSHGISASHCSNRNMRTPKPAGLMS